jgi:hypothetical protein
MARKKVIERIPMENSPAYKIVYEDGTIGIGMDPIDTNVGPEPQGPYEGMMNEPMQPGEGDQLMEDYMMQMKQRPPESYPAADEPLPRKK